MNPSNNWYAKARQLVEQHKAPSFSEACAQLARRRRKKAPAVPVPSSTYRLPYSDN